MKFYLDLGCTFLLNVIEHVFCCGERDAQNNRNLDGGERLNWNKSILVIRITLGLIINVTAFITVCVVNKETFVEGKTARGLFITIVVFTVLAYLAMEVLVWLDTSGADSKHILLYMIPYRTFEIEFDILVGFYSLVLSNWNMKLFTTTTTVLAIVDLVVNIIILGRNCYGYDNKHITIIIMLCGILLPPFLPIVAFMSIIRNKYM